MNHSEKKPIIEARSLVKKFRSGDSDFVVLKGLDLVINAGEFVAITGRSGSGKSTLLYQLGLLDHPSGGEVFIDGSSTTALPHDKRTRMRLMELGYVFQDYALIPDLNAVENIVVPLLMQGMKKPDAYEKAKKALDRLGLGSKAQNLPSQMSGGEQQRVSIARAIAHDPKILFADEPTANLDVETSRMVLDAFLDLHASGQTIIMVTHEPEYAEMTERILTLSDGVIVSEQKMK